MSENTKKCPFCAEEINIEAIKCKHCGSSLNEKDNIPEEIIYRKSFESTPTIRCKKCGYEGKAEMYRKGNSFISLLLFIFTVIIGWLIYEIWRGKHLWRCPKCHNELLQRVK